MPNTKDDLARLAVQIHFQENWGGMAARDELLAISERLLGERDALTTAAEAGLMLFEYLGEQLNAQPLPPLSAAHFGQVGEWIDCIRAVVPEARRKELVEKPWDMLDGVEDSDETTNEGETK